MNVQETQCKLRGIGWVHFTCEADKSKVYAYMTFTGETGIEQASSFLVNG